MKRALTTGLLALTFGLGALAGDHGYPGGGPGGDGTPVPPPPTVSDGDDGGTPGDIEQGVDTYGTKFTNDSIRRILFSIVKRMGRQLMMPRNRRLVEAGPVIHDLEVSADVSYDDIEMTDPGLTGYAWEETLGVSASIGKIGTAGAAVTNNRTYLRGRAGSEIESNSADAFASFDITDFLSAGGFVTGSTVDVEEIRGDGSVTGGGLTLSGYQKLGKADLTATAALARLRHDVLDCEYDTTLSGLAEIQYPWSDGWTSSVYGFVTDSLLTDDGMGDRTFGAAGAELLYSPTDRWAFSVGYERTVGLQNFRDNRILGSVRFSW